ncbi:hypothetical protein [Teichococcus oryzae]|uniref:Uncharacterized protein n=1 Tax=Teichococcus oryzae TaxID=1608942 RepID=A0A5B2TGH6_9PROT|nr:hypothetical protein [Pseudoroseomonas oryzae]KAA2213606.1 hypothetical protein F0Q34_10285 [Pseudoroseomonas oryzae]
MFDKLIHADWSVSPGKRWVTPAERQAGRWVVGALALVGLSEASLDRAFAAAAGQGVLPECGELGMGRFPMGDGRHAPNVLR